MNTLHPYTILVHTCTPGQVGSLPALITAAIALGTSGTVFSSSGGSSNVTTASIESGIIGSSGFLVALTILAVVMEILFIVLRICNIGLINLKISVFLIIVSTCREVSFNIIIGRLKSQAITVHYKY